VALLVLVPGAPARADHSGLEISLRDTGPFGDRLPHSLFRGAGHLVPGDRVERTLYVRNGSGTPVSTTVQVGFDRGNDLSDALDFRVAIGGVDAPRAVGDAGRLTFAGGLALDPGQVQPIDVDLIFDHTSGTRAMEQRTEVDLTVTITETTGTHHGLGCTEDVELSRDPGSGVTADTERPSCVPTGVPSGLPGSRLGLGSLPAPGSLVVDVLAWIGGGALVVALARRRREVAERG
jgi:hypothetical protein